MKKHQEQAHINEKTQSQKKGCLNTLVIVFMCFVVLMAGSVLWYLGQYRKCRSTVMGFRNTVVVGENLLLLEIPELSGRDRLLVSQRDIKGYDKDECGILFSIQGEKVEKTLGRTVEQKMGKENLVYFLRCGAVRFHFVVYPARGWFNVHFKDDGTITFLSEPGFGGD